MSITIFCKVCGRRPEMAYEPRSRYLGFDSLPAGAFAVEWRPSKRQNLCDPCNAETPRKVSREAFEKRYWGARVNEVPNSVRYEFWSDYLTSSETLANYITTTTTTTIRI
jgi:hypothetical protein